MTKSLKFFSALSAIVIVGFLFAGQFNVHAGGDGSAYKQIGVYSEVLGHIRSDYVEEPNMPAVTDGALHGLVESLDNNSSYLSPAEYKLYKDQYSHADFNADIGASVSKHFGYGYILSVYPGSPAEKAGLENGDILESIDGKTSHEMSVAEIHARMRGLRGSHIKFNVIRARKVEPFNITVLRDLYTPPANTQKMLEDSVAYFRIYSLGKDRIADLAAKIKTVQSSGAKKILLDLRATAEGDAADGVTAANLFLEKGTIAELKGQQFTKQSFEADASKQVTKLPVVLIVNRYTANAAEVMAAALQDAHRAELVGEKTYGSASMQKEFTLPDGGALMLSVAKFYSPSGKAIQDSLITPGTLVVADQIDTVVPDDEDVLPAGAPKKTVIPKTDDALQKALEVLKKAS